MPRRPFSNARCVVTGGSSGLGRALAAELTVQGARVVIVGRSAERLEEAARALRSAAAVPDDAVMPFVADLTRPEDRRRLWETVAERFDDRLDLLVNAAGIGAYGRFESHDPSVLRQIVEINLFALAEMCREALPLLRRGDHPAVVNLGSIVARRALPGRSEYAASKFAVAAFTESIRAEWAIDGIDVLLVNPGFTATNFDRNLVVDTAIYKTSHKRHDASRSRRAGHPACPATRPSRDHPLRRGATPSPREPHPPALRGLGPRPLDPPSLPRP